MLHSEGLEKRQGHRVLAVFGAFRLLLGGGTHVQHPLAKYVIYLDFSKSLKNLYLINSCFFYDLLIFFNHCMILWILFF